MMKRQLISTLGALMLTTGALNGATAKASQLQHKPAHYTYNQGGYQTTLRHFLNMQQSLQK